MISFRQNVTLHQIEAAYRLVDDAEELTLRVPSALRFGGNVGVQGALIQFAAYWSRGVRNARLRLYGEGLADEPHGIAALYFASETSDSTNSLIPKRIALEPAVDRLHAMQEGRYLDTMHGRGVFLACFARARNEYLNPFYAAPSDGGLRSRDEFITLTSKIIAACAPTAERSISMNQLGALGALMYELFKNTHEHAVTDELGVRYPKNIRGVLAKFIAVVPSDGRDELLSGEDSAHAFFMLRSLANKKRHLQQDGRLRAGLQSHFLELTVVDTGPGLVKRWLSKKLPGTSFTDLSVEEEVNIVKHCFEMHASTKDNRSSGGGLDRVVQTLRELKGFLRLRTGRVCLVQDFSAERSNKFDPRHWDLHNTELAATTGATYSIIIPLSRAQA